MGFKCADKGEGCMQIKSKLTLLWGRDEKEGGLVDYNPFKSLVCPLVLEGSMEISRIITVVCPNCHLTTVLRRLEILLPPPVWSLGHETPLLSSSFLMISMKSLSLGSSVKMLLG